MIRCRPRLPLDGESVHAPIWRAKPKTKTFLRRENQNQLGSSKCPRWPAPNDSKITRKEPLLPPNPLPTFRLILR